MKRKKTWELGRRCLLTALVLAVYMAGRSLLLYHVDPAAYQLEELNAQNIIASMVSGDRYQYTVFALGIMPYITSNLLIWLYTALRGSDFKSRVSPRKMERATLALMLAIAAVSAVSRAGELVFKPSGLNMWILQTIAAVELLLGAVVIYQLAKLNKDHGIGGNAPIILVNIADNLLSTVRKFSWQQLRMPAFLCLGMAMAVLIMENIIIRTPVQRVSIHNDYADKSYIAFKLDPIGMMPVMFAASFFMIPQSVVRLLLLMDRSNPVLRLLAEKLNLTDPIGANVYLGTIFLLNILFSFIMLEPGEMAKRLQKVGDSIVGVYAGKKTKWYLRRKLFLLAICSGVILCLLMGTSLALALNGAIPPELALFPASTTILTGLLCPLYQEIKAYKKFDSYSFFI